MSLPIGSRMKTTRSTSGRWRSILGTRDTWSNVYQSSGEAFHSASPRRFVQLQMILSTDDPQVAPVVDVLSIEFTDAFVQTARGRIWPPEARLNAETRFTYTLWPESNGEDGGFDRLRFKVAG